jgi:prolyl-tRNA editing enzyme YbaK/EbsC (Cys-tRNA(Pro) deacylase)
MATSSSSTAPKLKKVKVLTRRPRPHSLEKTAAVLGTEKVEMAEQAEATPWF